MRLWQCDGVVLTTEDAGRLRPGEMLNDAIMDSFFKLLHMGVQMRAAKHAAQVGAAPRWVSLVAGVRVCAHRYCLLALHVLQPCALVRVLDPPHQLRHDAMLQTLYTPCWLLAKFERTDDRFAPTDLTRAHFRPTMLQASVGAPPYARVCTVFDLHRVVFPVHFQPAQPGQIFEGPPHFAMAVVYLSSGQAPYVDYFDSLEVRWLYSVNSRDGK